LGTIQTISITLERDFIFNAVTTTHRVKRQTQQETQ